MRRDMNRIEKQYAAGFTLIEILLVVVIIGILAAVVVPRFSGRTREAEIARAKMDLASVGTALRTYELDLGEFPASLEALLTEPAANPERWKGPYIEKGMPKDPWGRLYMYAYPGVHNKRSYDLKSLGPDGVESEDDIVNWETDASGPTTP